MQDLEEAIEALHPDCRVGGSCRYGSLDGRRGRAVYAAVRALGVVSPGRDGGIISGYNFGRFGVGSHERIGLVTAPTAIAQFGRFGLNVILVPPIPDDNLPFTLGFQAKYRFK